MLDGMTIATDMLAKYLAAEIDLLAGKEAAWGDRRLKMEDLAEIRKGRQEWEQRVAAERRTAAGSSGLSVGGATFSQVRIE